jgi:hypothetical protein
MKKIKRTKALLVLPEVHTTDKEATEKGLAIKPQSFITFRRRGITVIVENRLKKRTIYLFKKGKL